jgi:serine/threonine protein kinase
MLCSRPGTVQPRVCIAYEMADLGSLSQAIGGGEGRQLTAKEAALVLRGGALGLEALHAAGVLHCDVKPANLLVFLAGPRAPPAVLGKIGDLGLLQVEERGSIVTTPVRGTPWYAAPESVGSNSYTSGRLPAPRPGGGGRAVAAISGGTQFSSASDVYSFGLCLGEVFCGGVPNKGVQPAPNVGKLFVTLKQLSLQHHTAIAECRAWEAAGASVLKLIVEGRWRVPEPAARKLSALLVGCLAIRPSQRPGAKMVAQELHIVAHMMSA